jgi:hypothetical protein
MRLLLSSLLIALPFSAIAQQDCPVTAENPVAAFTPPAEYGTPLGSGSMWYGNQSLWTSLPNGPMHVAEAPRLLSDKLVFWRVGFNWKQEPAPDLKVIARRLDAPAPLLQTGQVHGVLLANEETQGNMAMMTGIAFHEPGCWQIVAIYKGMYLAYVVSVTR